MTTTDGTVEALLEDLGVSVGHQDDVSATSSSSLHNGERIDVTRIKSGNVVARRARRRSRRRRSPTPAMYVGHEASSSKHGKNGEEKVTYAVVYVDGRQVGRTIISRKILIEPIPAVVKVGTKPKPQPSAADRRRSRLGAGHRQEPRGASADGATTSSVACTRSGAREQLARQCRELDRRVRHPAGIARRQDGRPTARTGRPIRPRRSSGDWTTSPAGTARRATHGASWQANGWY